MHQGKTMNERIEHCLYQAGLTAQGCWDELDDYAKEGIQKFAKLVVKECIHVMKDLSPGYNDYRNQIENAFRRDCVVEIQRRFDMQEIDNG
jgi:hypothetical protein